MIAVVFITIVITLKVVVIIAVFLFVWCYSDCWRHCFVTITVYNHLSFFFLFWDNHDGGRNISAVIARGFSYFRLAYQPTPSILGSVFGPLTLGNSQITNAKAAARPVQAANNSCFRYPAQLAAACT